MDNSAPDVAAPVADPDLRPFAVVPLDLISDPDLPPRAVQVWALLAARWANRADACWPSRRTIADALGISTDAVDRALTALTKNGWLTVERRTTTDGAPTSNRYTLHRRQRESAATPSRTDAATPSRRNPAQTKPIQNQTQTDSTLSRENATARPRPDDVANTITRAFYEHIKSQTGYAPLWPYVGVRKLVAKAVRAGWPERAIKLALLAVHQAQRPITGQTLDDALRRLEPATSRQTTERGSVDPEQDRRPASWEADALAAVIAELSASDDT